MEVNKQVVYAHNDPKQWGARFKEAASELGVDCILFDKADEVPEGAKAFVRLDQTAEQRGLSKSLVADLFQRGVKTLPNLQEAIWYDSKIEQVQTFGKYLPDTFLTFDRHKAYKAAANTQYPFISKSTDGSASKGVRLIKSWDDADKEILSVFDDPDGLDLGFYGRKQKGYVYWQKFVENNPHDYRIVICNNYIFGLVRWNRKDKPFASGSGKHEPIIEITGRAEKAMDFCIKIALELELKWMAFDVVFDGDEPKLLEVSSSWTPSGYVDCPVWDFGYFPQEMTGKDMFKMAVGAVCLL